MANKPKRRRMRVQSIEEKMAQKLVQIHGTTYKKAWDIVKLKAMQRDMQMLNDVVI